MFDFFSFSRSIASSLASEGTVASVTSVAASAAKTTAATSSSVTALLALTLSTFSLNGLGADSAGLGLDLGLSNSELSLDVIDSSVVQSIVVMSPY